MTPKAAAPIWFDLNGADLRVCASPEHLHPLSPYLAELRGAGPRVGTPFDLSIVTQVEDPTPYDGAILIFEGQLPEGARCRLYQAGDSRLLIVPGQLSARLSPTSALIGVVPGSERLIGGSAGILAIEAAAVGAGQTLVHAAALALPDEAGAIMIFAPSGAGKTTTALALAITGFGLLTDDAVFLQASGDGHSVWGLPRPLKAHRRTAALLPAIAPLLGDTWDREDEQALSRESVAMIAAVPPPRPLPLVAIVLLGDRTGEATHHMAPASRSEMLVRLAADNVAKGPSGLLAPELRRFEALSRAVAATPAYELRVGGDLTTLAVAVRHAIG